VPRQCGDRHQRLSGLHRAPVHGGMPPKSHSPCQGPGFHRHGQVREVRPLRRGVQIPRHNPSEAPVQAGLRGGRHRQGRIRPRGDRLRQMHLMRTVPGELPLRSHRRQEPDIPDGLRHKKRRTRIRGAGAVFRGPVRTGRYAGKNEGRVQAAGLRRCLRGGRGSRPMRDRGGQRLS